MSGLVCVILGGALMTAGVLLLYAWVNNKSKWFDANFDQQNSPRVWWLFMCFYVMYFVAMVVTPLLGGAILIVYWLTE